MIYRLLVIASLLLATNLKLSGQDLLSAALKEDIRRYSKVCSITSLDGGINKVQIIPDYINNILRIKYLNDTINIHDYWGVPPKARAINNNFIAIMYAVRGGSNLGLSNTLIICASKGVLHIAMFIQDYSDSDTGDEKKFYEVKLVLNKENKNHLILNFDIHDEVNSKAMPETNYNYRGRTILHFDKTLKVFYSVKTYLYQTFFVDNSKIIRYINGTYPMVILGKNNYYFIDGDWYVIVDGNHLSKFN